MYALQLNEKIQDNKNMIASLLVVVLFAMGVSYPTSTNGQISSSIYQVAPVISGIFICILVPLISKVKLSFAGLFLLTNSILWAVTLFNEPTQLNRGVSTLFTILTLMFCINFRKIEVKRSVFVCFKIVNIIIIAIGWGMMLKNQGVDTFFINHYTDFYPELVPNMLSQGKPVIVFGTHSVAGFYLFLFFFLNIKTYESIRKKRYFIYSINYLVFCYSMHSNTGIMLMLFGLFYLIYHSKKKLLCMLILTVTASFLLYIGNFNFGELLMMFDPNKSGNGLLGRYSSEGNLQNDLAYIMQNPFSAIGYSVSQNNLIFYDSGIISTALRGTLVVTILIYFSLFLFLKYNLIKKTTGIFLFFVFFIFEFGFDNLFYFRTIFLLPFFIMYLNYLQKLKDSNEAYTT